MKFVGKICMFLAGILMIASYATPAFALTGVRSLPEMYGAGGIVEVSIVIDVDENSAPNAIIVKEEIPSAWTLNSYSVAPSINSGGEIKWLIEDKEDGVDDMTIKYTLSVPPGQSGEKTFNDGEIKFTYDNIEYTESITGDAVILEAVGCVVEEESESICDDGLDNDCDGVKDYADDTCAAQNSAPDKPSLVYPGQGELTGTTVDFEWEETSDPDGDTLLYTLIVCEDDQLSVECVTRENIHARSVNKMHVAGGAAGLIFFGITFTGGMSKRRSILMLIIVASLSLLLSCGSGGGSSGGGGGNNDGDNNDGDVVIQEDDNVKQTIAGLDNKTSYYWQVIVDDGKNGTERSEVRWFVTE